METLVVQEKTVEITIPEYVRLIRSNHLVELLVAIYDKDPCPSYSVVKALLDRENEYE